MFGRKSFFAALALTAGTLFAGAAQAGVNWSFNVQLPGPVYAQPYYDAPPAYYAPPPVTYYRPEPVYYRPAPVYYRPPAVIVRGGPSWHHNHRHPQFRNDRHDRHDRRDDRRGGHYGR